MSIFYSLFLIITPAAASFILFLRIKKNRILVSKSFFWHYAFGFFIFTLVHIPIFFINLGVTISYRTLITLNFVSFLAMFFSYLLFYRGSLLLFTKERFLTTVFPLIVLPIIATLAVISLLVLKIESLIRYTAVVWGFLLPNNTYLGSIFLYFFVKGAPFDSAKRQSGILVLGLAWFLVLATDIHLWIHAVTYDPQFWIIKIASLKGDLVFRSFAYLLILIGCLLYSRGLNKRLKDSKTEKKV